MIFAINHQNALLDALLISVISWRGPHFMTRADVFTNPLVDKILRGLKMLPIYRFRDGYDSIKKNEEVFEAARKILLKSGAVAIFPEGSHSLSYQVRPLKKGFARIAFMSEEAADFDLDLKVVPVGIQYESHFYPSGRTLISFGEPICVADYKDRFLTDHNQALDALTRDLRERMKHLVLHIDSRANYDDVLMEYKNRRVYRKDLVGQLMSDQRLVEAIMAKDAFDEQPDQLSWLQRAFRPLWDWFWMIVGAIPKWIVDLLVKRFTRDPHFFGTMRFLHSLYTYPIFFFIVFLFLRYLVS